MKSILLSIFLVLVTSTASSFFPACSSIGSSQQREPVKQPGVLPGPSSLPIYPTWGKILIFSVGFEDEPHHLQAILHFCVKGPGLACPASLFQSSLPAWVTATPALFSEPGDAYQAVPFFLDLQPQTSTLPPFLLPASIASQAARSSPSFSDLAWNTKLSEEPYWNSPVVSNATFDGDSPNLAVHPIDWKQDLAGQALPLGSTLKWVTKAYSSLKGKPPAPSPSSSPAVSSSVREKLMAGFLKGLGVSSEEGKQLLSELTSLHNLPQVLASFDEGFDQGVAQDLSDNIDFAKEVGTFVWDHNLGAQLYSVVKGASQIVKGESTLSEKFQQHLSKLKYTWKQVSSMGEILLSAHSWMADMLHHPEAWEEQAERIGYVAGKAAHELGFDFSPQKTLAQKSQMLGKAAGYITTEVLLSVLAPEAMAKLGKGITRFIQEEKLAERLKTALQKRGLFSNLIKEGGMEVKQASRSQALVELMDSFQAAGRSESEVEKISTRLLEELGEGEAKALVKTLGKERMLKLLDHLNPKEIQGFLTLLGEKEMIRVCDKFGGEVMKHYGPQFFAWLPNAVTEDVLNHIIYNEGIWNGEIHGCHDQVQFLQTLAGQGQVVSMTPQTHPDIVYYQYKLYQKKKDLSFVSPLQLSISPPKEKSVISGLEKNKTFWKQIFQEALEDAVKKKKIPLAGGEFIGQSHIFEFIFYYRNSKLMSIFPKGIP